MGDGQWAIIHLLNARQHVRDLADADLLLTLLRQFHAVPLRPEDVQQEALHDLTEGGDVGG